jgi:hypothetical protein
MPGSVPTDQDSSLSWLCAADKPPLVRLLAFLGDDPGSCSKAAVLTLAVGYLNRAPLATLEAIKQSLDGSSSPPLARTRSDAQRAAFVDELPSPAPSPGPSPDVSPTGPSVLFGSPVDVDANGAEASVSSPPAATAAAAAGVLNADAVRALLAEQQSAFSKQLQAFKVRAVLRHDPVAT